MALNAPSSAPSPGTRARKHDLFSSNPAAVVGRARGHALCVGQIALEIASAPVGARAALVVEMRRYVRDYVDAAYSVLHDASLGDVLAPAAAECARLLAFADELVTLDRRDYAPLDPSAAAALARRTRERVLFDLYAVITAIQTADATQEAARLAELEARSARLDRHLAERAALARALRAVGLTAKVEGGALEGASARVFQSMAAQVAQLAEGPSAAGPDAAAS